MTRQLYQVKNDLDYEKKVAEYLEIKWSVRFQKMSIKYYIDFMIFKANKANGVAEIKRRHYKSTDFSTLILSLAKWNRGVEYFNINKLKFLIISGWDDGLFFYQYRKDDVFDIVIGGRKDRKDPEDQEPIVHIPVGLFKKID